MVLYLLELILLKIYYMNTIYSEYSPNIPIQLNPVEDRPFQNIGFETKNIISQNSPNYNFQNNSPKYNNSEKKEKVITKELSDKPPITMKNEPNKSLQSIENSGENLHLDIHPGCREVTIDGKKSQLCPSEIFKKLSEKEKKEDQTEKEKLATLFKDDPLVANSLSKILKDGNLKLWNQIADIGSKEQHQLPDPKSIFSRARDKYNLLMKVKDSLSKELLTDEKLVKRVKSYLDENKDIIERNEPILQDLLEKIPTVQDTVMKKDLAERYMKLYKEAVEVFDLHNQEKDWLEEVLTLFGSLFAFS